MVIQQIFINTHYIQANIFLMFYSRILDLNFIVYLVYVSLADSESVTKIYLTSKQVSILIGNACIFF